MANGSPDIAEVERRARAGDASAQYMLSAMLARSGRREESRVWLKCAVDAGDVDALYTFACLKLDGVDGPRDVLGAVEILKAASENGGAAATRTLAALTALGSVNEPSLTAAIDLLRRAASAGDETSQIQVALVGDGAFSRPIPDRIELSRAPDVWRIDGLLTREECKYLVDAVKPLLHDSFVVDPGSGRAMKSTVRTSSTASVHPFQQDLVMHCINMRVSEAAGLPLEQGEMLSVLRYQPGQQYFPHFDFLDSASGLASQWTTAGQRVATLLVSLNDDYEGGETYFLSNGLTYKGKTGDALLFWNVNSSGEPDITTRHAGKSVTSGVKWLLSKWFREKPFVY
jgi:prolyl 4-hydroxylase